MKPVSFLRRQRQSALAALFVGLNLNIAQAQEAVPSPILTRNSVTLDGLVAEALEKNPELAFYQAEIAAAKGGRKSAGLFGNPQINGDLGRKSVRGDGLGGEGAAWAVTVVQPFEWPGRIGLRKAIANRDIELAELGYGRFKIALAARVRVLTYAVFAAEEKAAASDEVAERFKSLRETVVQREPAGLTPLLETRIIEATEVNAQRRASEARLIAQSALLELNQLRGAKPDTRLAIEPIALTFRSVDKVEVLVAMAQTNNFEIRTRAAELAQQGFRVNLAKNERYPTLSVGPSISEARAGDRERIIGIGISMPLPLWNRNQGGIDTAKARQAQAETSYYITQREVERKVTEAALSYRAKIQEMAKWLPDSVQHFKEAAELADRHYRLGAVPVSVYVELQQQYLEAVNGLLDTKREALEAAAQLELLTGLPLPLASPTPTQEKP